MSIEPRMAELTARLDQLAAEFSDILSFEDQNMPMSVGVVLVTAWADPTDIDDDLFVRPTPSASTSLITQIGMLTFAAARVVE